jgi:hypothetical protein
MRKPKRKPRPARCPTMVAMVLAPEVGIIERLALQAFLDGRADLRDFDILADCRDLLTLAAEERHDVQVLGMCETVWVALMNIRDRYLAFGVMAAHDGRDETQNEAGVLIDMLDVSDDFWRRQGGNLYADANRALDKARGYQREARQ